MIMTRIRATNLFKSEIARDTQQGGPLKRHLDELPATRRGAEQGN